MYAVVQVETACVGLMALVLLVLLRTDLVDSWRNAAATPNRFVINITPEQAEELPRCAAPGRRGAARLVPREQPPGVHERRDVGPADYAEDRARLPWWTAFSLSYAARRQQPAAAKLKAMPPAWRKTSPKRWSA